MSDIKGRVARKYALALLRSFNESEDSADIGKLNAVENALFDVARSWKENPDFRERFTRPTVLSSEKADALMQIGEYMAKEHGVSPSDYFARFLVLVDENGRLGGIGEIADSFSNILRQLREELVVKVVTAKELSDDEKSQVVSNLKSSASANLSDVEWMVDADLIGGAIIRCGDTEIDGSVRGALSAARTALVAR